MNRIIKAFLVMALIVVMAPAAAFATNGDNLIGVGPISRAMGGVGIAAPQDAISAVFANPAGMCFGPYCPGSEVNFGATLFMPTPKAKIQAFGTESTASSDEKTYAIPAIGLSVPINPSLRFGLAAYGVSGLGVDYRNTGLNFGGGPAEVYTQYQIMKFSPNIAYQVNDNLSLGLGVHVNYAALDLQDGSSFNYSVGAQLGAIYKVGDMISLGATYKTPQSATHENVIDFDGDGSFDDLDLEIPQEVGLGVAVEPVPGTLLLELNGKWVNWSSADGYEDFDWDDQYVVAVGGQFKPNEKLALRVGYNFSENPVNVHNGFSLNPADTVSIQGKVIPEASYEVFRIIGFPAIVEQHATVGVGYEFSKNFALNLAYMHAFEKTITENDSSGLVTLESTLEEDSVEFGLTWRFD